MRLESQEGIEAWQRMRQSAAGALTRFRLGEQTKVPAQVSTSIG